MAEHGPPPTAPADPAPRGDEPLYRSVAEALQEAEAALARLRREFERLQAEALTDQLTGLYNRRHFMQRLLEECQRSQRHGLPFSLLYADIDDFRTLNERLGHPQADRILQALSARLRAHVRISDVVARIGGDEFVVLAPGTPAGGGLELGERLRRAVAASPFEAGSDDGRLVVSVSIGGATFPDDARDDVSLLEMADAALYRAKQSGKNRVVWAGKAENPPAGDRQEEAPLATSPAAEAGARPCPPQPAQSAPAAAGAAAWQVASTSEATGTPVVVGYGTDLETPMTVWLGELPHRVVAVESRQRHGDDVRWQIRVAPPAGGPPVSIALLQRGRRWNRINS